MHFPKTARANPARAGGNPRTAQLPERLEYPNGATSASEQSGFDVERVTTAGTVRARVDRQAVVTASQRFLSVILGSREAALAFRLLQALASLAGTFHERPQSTLLYPSRVRIWSDW